MKQAFFICLKKPFVLFLSPKSMSKFTLKFQARLPCHGLASGLHNN